MGLTSTVDKVRRRGDTFPLQYAVKNEDGTDKDITGATFLLSVYPQNEPRPVSAANMVFQVAGVITVALTGKVEFRPTVDNMDQTPDIYYYDIQMTDSGAFISTIVEGSLTIKQDRTK